MDELSVALFKYDLTNNFSQVFINAPSDVWIRKEIRFSKNLWNHLLQNGHSDPQFASIVSLEHDIAALDQGIVGYAYGVTLTTEWVLEHASKMTPLPGFFYLLLYVPKVVQPTPTPQPVNLLNLAHQVTSP